MGIFGAMLQGFWYELKDLFAQQKLADKVVLDRKNRLLAVRLFSLN